MPEFAAHYPLGPRHKPPRRPDRGFMFMPEIGDEVAVAFEDGDPERPVILGSMWNGVQQAPRKDLLGGDIQSNDLKRIMTKSGNRMQFADKEGKEMIIIATPTHSQFMISEKHDVSGRPLITLSTSGDIVLSAPEGSISMIAKTMTREIG